jgi:hypothetical protein
MAEVQRRSVNFGDFYNGLDTVGYTLLGADHAVVQVRIAIGTAAAREVFAGTGTYDADVSLPRTTEVFILWDTGDPIAPPVDYVKAYQVDQIELKPLQSQLAVSADSVLKRDFGLAATGVAIPDPQPGITKGPTNLLEAMYALRGFSLDPADQTLLWSNDPYNHDPTDAEYIGWSRRVSTLPGANPVVGIGG